MLGLVTDELPGIAVGAAALVVTVAVQVAVASYLFGKIKATTEALSSLVNDRDHAQSAMLEAYKELQRQANENIIKSVNAVVGRLDRGYNEIAGITEAVQVIKLDLTRLQASVEAQEAHRGESLKAQELWRTGADRRFAELSDLLRGRAPSRAASR